jgi:RES domain-containing protein
LIRVFRVLREAYARSPFDGEGAYRYGGRWSSPGTRLTYASEHQSLAMLEYLAHLDPEDAPDDLILAAADLPDSISRKRLAGGDLPANWRQTPAPPELTQLGDDFVEKAESCVLLVPSALAVHEFNYLINPQHSDFKAIALHPPEPLRYDSRLFRRETRRPKHGSKPAIATVRSQRAGRPSN